MSQTILDKDTIIKVLTPIERLQKLRMDYYIELLTKIDNLRNKRISLIQNYKQNVYDIDKQIEIEKQREKNRLKTMNSQKV
jgi:hypothetical protein